jgi:hypothetical protein
VLLLQELQRHIHTNTLAAMMAAAVGAQVEMPDETEIRAEFDAALRAEPKRESPERLALMRGLGLRD